LTAARSIRNRGGRSEGGLPPPSPQSLVPSPPQKKWFIAGGIDQGNIEKALALGPYGVDVSSGAESGGVKDREKILRLVETVRRWGGKP
jgi:phosphoribosylanthranilate isomerase